jgi:hypothetical protein
MKTYRGVKVYLHHSWPWHWMEVSNQLHEAAALPPEKEPSVPNKYEAGWAPGQVCALQKWEKFLASAGNRTPVVQPVACRYTD